MDRAANQLVRVEQGRRLGLYAAVLFVVFLLGFVPMWLQARSRANERDAAHQALRSSQLETTLAAAAIQARRGDYDPAREAASTFYTNLTAELARMPSEFTPAQRERMQAMLSERDQLITLLARADPAVAERLADTYVSYRQTMGTLSPPAGSGM